MVQIGLYSSDGGYAVPLEGVHVEAKIVDMVAKVSIVQYYCNTSNNTLECKYTFPLDSFSSVCGFEAEIDGKIIEAIVKEKTQAKREYNEAIQRGDGAYLLEEQKEDIFQVSVGNIPPLTRVNVWLSYVTELKVDADMTTRFLLPTSVAPRFSPSSNVAWRSASSWFEVFPKRRKLFSRSSFSSKAFQRLFGGNGGSGGGGGGGSGLDISSSPKALSVMLEIESPSPITEVISHTHDIEVSIESPTSAIVTFLHPNEVTGKDFIINYKMNERPQARAIFESNDDEEEVSSVSSSPPGLVSAMLTLVPQFALNETTSELIFIVDRSGSMSGKRIEQAKDALLLFLRALPVDCYFNIIGFGSNYETLYPTSQRYNQSTLLEATNHINSMTANLGGTVITTPLHVVFNSQPIMGYARNIFILTDGEVSNTEEVIALINKNASTCRVFSLGIGETVSHHLVEGMARAGRGNAKFIVENQRLDVTIMRQLKDSLQPSLTDIKINWGLDGFNVSSSPSPSIADLPVPVVHGSLIGHKSEGASGVPQPRQSFPICQAPFHIPPIFSGNRFIVYAFLHLPPSSSPPSPRYVEITAMSKDGPLSLRVEVEYHHGNIVQKLVARSLIRDLEEGTSWLHSSKNNSADMIRSEIVRLGTSFQLASKYTSFLAIEPRLYTPPPQPKPQIQSVSYKSSSSNYNTVDRISRVQSVNDQMMNNIEKILARGEKLESLSCQSESLSASSSQFYLNSAKQQKSSNMMSFGGGGIISSMGSSMSSMGSSISNFFSNVFSRSGSAPPPSPSSPSPTPSSSSPQPPPSSSSSSSSNRVNNDNKNNNNNNFIDRERDDKIKEIDTMMEEIKNIYADLSQEIENQNQYLDHIDINIDTNVKTSKIDIKVPTICSPREGSISKDKIMREIVLLQSFEGLFHASEKLASILGYSSLSVVRSAIPSELLHVSGVEAVDIWISVLVIHYFSSVLSELKDSWEMIVDKCRAYICSHLPPNVSYNDLLKLAAALQKK